MMYGDGPSGRGRTGAIQLGFWTHRDRVHSVTVIASNKGSTLCLKHYIQSNEKTKGNLSRGHPTGFCKLNTKSQESYLLHKQYLFDIKLWHVATLKGHQQAWMCERSVVNKQLCWLFHLWYRQKQNLKYTDRGDLWQYVPFHSVSA
jgi:hypothetical protein